MQILHKQRYRVFLILKKIKYSVPELDLRKKCLKCMAYVFRVQFAEQFQNGLLENPSIRDSGAKPNN